MTIFLALLLLFAIALLEKRKRIVFEIKMGLWKPLLGLFALLIIVPIIESLL